MLAPIEFPFYTKFVLSCAIYVISPQNSSNQPFTINDKNAPLSCLALNLKSFATYSTVYNCSMIN